MYDIIQRMASSSEMTSMSTSDKMLGSLMVALFAMAIVFFVLALIILLLTIMDKILNTTTKKEETVSQVSKSEVSQQTSSEDEEELIAVITAAIAMEMGRSQNQFIVKNIVRTSGKESAWAQNGRLEQMQSLY